jgi:hypothetical protein
MVNDVNSPFSVSVSVFSNFIAASKVPVNGYERPNQMYSTFTFLKNL